VYQSANQNTEEVILEPLIGVFIVMLTVFLKSSS